MLLPWSGKFGVMDGKGGRGAAITELVIRRLGSNHRAASCDPTKFGVLYPILPSNRHTAWQHVPIAEGIECIRC